MAEQNNYVKIQTLKVSTYKWEDYKWKLLRMGQAECLRHESPYWKISTRWGRQIKVKGQQTVHHIKASSELRPLTANWNSKGTT